MDTQEIEVIKMNTTIRNYMGIDHLSNPVHRLLFHSSWDWLMPVWSRVYNTLDLMPLPNPLYNIHSINKIIDDITRHLQNPNITEAHRLIYEAIQWLTVNNKTT
jgi:hypothetical protein